MPQLPRVVVLGTGLTGVAALYGLVDGGLWAVAVDLAPATRMAGARATGSDRAAPDPSATFAERFGLLDRIRLVPGPVEVRTADPQGPFTISGGPGSAELVADAVVVADSHLAPDAWVADPARLFLGMFDPAQDRVFRVDGEPPASGPPGGDDADPEIRMRIAQARGRLLGEYLRGRYLLPPRSEVAAGGPPHGARRTVARLVDQIATRVGAGDPIPRYLRTMHRELARGHARAGVAGYPLPCPRF